jgi:hypothetical protein
MKRGAERQLIKDEFEEFEDGHIEPEARLTDPDDTHGSLIFHSQRRIQVSKKLPTTF